MEEVPDAEEIIKEELDVLDTELSGARRKHNLQRAASIIEYSEK